MLTVKKITPLLFLMPFILLMSLQVTGQVTGRTVNSVTFNGGGFYRITGLRWVETNAGGKDHANFTELQRDDWSVYLKKEDGSVVRIDIHLKSTFYTPAGGQPSELYQLTGWSNEMRVTGGTVNQARYNGGVFHKTSGNQWQELDQSGKHHAFFTELVRDDWSVYLKKEDGNELQIDMHRKAVFFKPVNGQYYEIYKLTGWSNDIVVTGKNVNHVTYDKGAFRRITGNQWVESDVNGKDFAYFTELTRDDWSVYLKKEDGNELQIDIHRRAIFFKPVNGQYFELYQLNGWYNQ